MNLLRKCYDMTDLKIGHSYQYNKLEFKSTCRGRCFFA